MAVKQDNKDEIEKMTNELSQELQKIGSQMYEQAKADEKKPEEEGASETSEKVSDKDIEEGEIVE